MVEKPAD